MHQQYAIKAIKKKKMIKCVFVCFCISKNEAIRWWERGTGGRALLSVCPRPEREESKDPQSAGDRLTPAGIQVHQLTLTRCYSPTVSLLSSLHLK